ncbi:hypothetical protein PBY51_005107 [Eleginops maclovinus]|uniref:Phostensin/Taperin PP1-binding domain-containing protein n=1 Tax=Eleginops maclovinus TaxID=56733 RepID=A0AAN7X3R5_ELEMC|nr:hypothetical protein PBY51_005107 [Eleginops maclovinus]
MSVTSLPEWKQLLLERKRREEEERERREKEEEDKYASMPAWKRGIIQRRKARLDSLGDREKERDICLLQVDVRSASDGLSDSDSFGTVNLESELSLSPEPGLWQDGDIKPASQVFEETIVPVHENPFFRTQSAWRKGQDADGGDETEAKETEKEKSSLSSQDGDFGRDAGIKLERFRDVSEGREKEKSRDRSQGRERENSNQWQESVKDDVREWEFLKVRKEGEENETDPPSSSFSANVPCLRTFRADNIIIIEQDRKGSDERWGRWREAERERPEQDQQGQRGMKMDLREILAGGGSITEIRASEVLIIKPLASSEERSPEGGGRGRGLGREDGEIKCSIDERRRSFCREIRTDISWLREKEKDRPWGQATVIKDEQEENLDDNVFVEKGGRVSQLLSKFGQHPKPPSRSKSSDNLFRPGRRKYSGDEDDQQSESDGRNLLLKGVPKRSLSFSDRVISGKENGLGNNGHYERKRCGRINSVKSVAACVDVAGLGKETTENIKLGCTLLSDKGRFQKLIDGQLKNEDKKEGPVQNKNKTEMSVAVQPINKVKKTVDTRAAERACDADGDEGFTVASVKNTEGISFARRVAIKQEGKARADREVKKQTGEKTLKREMSDEKDSEAGGKIEVHVCIKNVSDFHKKEGFGGTIPPEHLHNSQVASAFTECSSLLCAFTDRSGDPNREPEWSGTQGPFPTHSVLSQHTEELINKIEKIGDTTVYSRGERVFEKYQGSYQDVGSENLTRDVTPRSPKRIAPMGISPGPLEIQIPRSVFYVAEDMAERKKAVGQSDNSEGGKGVERRDSWRIGKPLSRIESLREKIRQKELETLRLTEAQNGSGSEAAGIKNIHTAGDKHDMSGTAIEKEREAAPHMRKKSIEVKRGQEDEAAQTTTTAFDVTQEDSVLKTSPQLPVSVSQTIRAEEVPSGYTTSTSGVISESLPISEDENDPVLHVEEELKRHKAQLEKREKEREEEEEEEEEKEEEKEEKQQPEEKVEENTLPLNSENSLSPLQPHPNSIIAMSRIYNLESVSSRSGMCLRDRTVDIPSVHLVKVKPLLSNAQQGDRKASSDEDITGVQTIQRQIEQFKMKEQELLKSCSSPNTPLKERETKGQKSPRGVLKYKVNDNTKTPEKDQEMPESKAKVSPWRVCSPTNQLKQSNQTTTSILRSQSPDNALKPSDKAPTPASSPSSTPPAQSPSVSPSPTPSTAQFSIRSASGGQVRRGATITITPKKPVEGKGVTGPTTAAGSNSPAQQAESPSTVTEPAKKKFPTVDEIEVIGGYQNLDKSCLVKYRGTPKRGNVCFAEDQLEQVCEYPSETSMLACTSYPQDPWRMEKQHGEEVQEEEAEVEKVAIVSKSMRNMGIVTGGALRVGQCHPLLKKHNV